MAKEIYFGHSFTFADTPEMFYLIQTGGIIAYARALLLIELLGNNGNTIDISNKLWRLMLIKRLECNATEVPDIVSNLAESGLFVIKDTILSSPFVAEVFERIEEKMEEISEKRRQSVMKRWNKKEPEQNTNGYNGIQNDTNAYKNIQEHANGYNGIQRHTYIKEKEKENKKEKENNNPPNPPSGGNMENASSSDVKEIVDNFNLILGEILPKVEKITAERQRKVKKLLERYQPAVIIKAFNLAKESDFLTGRDGKWTGCSFEFFLQPEKIQRVIEGTYNRTARIKTDHPFHNQKPTGNFYDQRQHMMLESIRKEEERERQEEENEKVRNEKSPLHNFDDQSACDISER